MGDQKKMASNERRDLIIQRLKKADSPITGNEFAKKTNVSRQVIVQDVSILKAMNEPIIATSQGYIYVNREGSGGKESLIIAVNHTPDQVQEELNIIVDQGVTVKDVIVEHSIYGDLTASIMVSNRAEVEQFVKRVGKTNATYLSTLTEGVHLHTLEADSIDKIKMACKMLDKANILLSESNS